MKYSTLLTAFLFLLGASAAISNTPPPNNISIGCSFATPPFIIQQNNRGIMLDTIRTSFQYEDIGLIISYSGNVDNLRDFRAKKLDALCISTPTLTPEAWLSTEPSMIFHNVAVSLTKHNYAINKLDDLRNYHIQAFGLALEMLPPDYALNVNLAPHYSEETDQIKQVMALFNGDVDVIIIERTVFRYFLSQLRRANPSSELLSQPYQYSEVLLPTVYHAAFQTQEMRDQFDRGFKRLQIEGRYLKIRHNYETLLTHYLIN